LPVFGGTPKDDLARAFWGAFSVVPGSVAFWQAAGFDGEMHSDDFAIAQNFGIELHIVLRQPR